jgi:hypothetical protein
MTTELKTLKDIEIEPNLMMLESEKRFLLKETGSYPKVVWNNVLKTEAIKWFKYAIKHHRNAYLAFMDFFNLSEEDLAE